MIKIFHLNFSLLLPHCFQQTGSFGVSPYRCLSLSSHSSVFYPSFSFVLLLSRVRTLNHLCAPSQFRGGERGREGRKGIVKERKDITSYCRRWWGSCLGSLPFSFTTLITAFCPACACPGMPHPRASHISAPHASMRTYRARVGSRAAGRAVRGPCTKRR